MFTLRMLILSVLSGIAIKCYVGVDAFVGGLDFDIELPEDVCQ